MQKFKIVTKKWQESDFCKMSPVHSANTLWVQNFVKIALSRTISKINALYAEIQDGSQKWLESDFCEKSSVDFADTLRVQNFVKITLSRNRFQDKCAFAFYTEIQDGENSKGHHF